MSQIHIQHYLNTLHDLKKISGTHRESVVREAFKDLLKAEARAHDLVFIPEYEIASPAKERRYVDGALLHALRMPFGYWEAKDAKDDLDAEIEYKFRRGYPQDNIIFEDSTKAVLIQNRQEIMRCGVDDVSNLEKLLRLFFSYERQEIANFRRAVEQFKVDLPAVLESLREMIEGAIAENAAFRKAAKKFLKHAQEAINPSLTDADVREMLIQHILTEEIFAKVFDEDDFHRQNNVAKELYALEGTFFTGDLKKRTLRGLDAYYAAIRAAAAQIGGHHEKQTFLKAIYENFYKVYNVKAADRLGVVYTPNEIVRFMIDSADWLCEKHFGKTLIDKEVEILDPATGTGTFICELLEHFRGQPAKLKYKYLEELHANEVAILPYYVANLNIEATYAAMTGEYLEFPNLCFVDTLDNVAGLRKYAGHMDDLFGSVSEENVGRIRRQNARKISVVIGNPPYNANQLNENENNKNREYPDIDKRIKETYIAASTAQKTKLYDMYARFLRWASDRVDENGIVAFITNRSFIDSRTFDGFRKEVAKEFNEIWVLDLGGDVRANPKLSGTKHNVFGIQTGVAISFLVKKKRAQGCRLFYSRRPELESADEKLAFLSNNQIRNAAFEEIAPDKNNSWLNIARNDFDKLLPIASKEVKAAKKPIKEKVIFKLFASAVKTNRDEWVYDYSEETAINKAALLIDKFNKQLSSGIADSDRLDYSIKWSSGLKAQRKSISIDNTKLITSLWRPFVKKYYYSEKTLSDRLTAFHFAFYGDGLCNNNPTINFVTGSRLSLSVLSSNMTTNYALFSLDPVQSLPLYRYDHQGEQIDNITDWALDQFRKHYQPDKGMKNRSITKEAIFDYVYAVLHDPIYREKYALNLKREFPRIPFYTDFWKWADWGNDLMHLHIDYEAVNEFSLNRSDLADDGHIPKTMLKADKVAGRIQLDSRTSLSSIPALAWEYKLGNRSALEWILDQYKESKPKDPTLREKFNTYRFADYKEMVISLLMRVSTVSVRTMEIVNQMKTLSR